ncbi:CDP-diacylglycerol--inositol 3-phosphatidyltransferase 1 [Bienertia sinuspersici]
MADRSKLRMSTIYLYVPNIIGYIRVLMNCVAFGICFSHKGLFSVLYFVSFVCDGIDGWFARKLNQVSTFGVVLDMVTDRISTACLLVILSQIYRPSLIFVSLLALDIASHWFQMYSTFLTGKASHKDVKDSSSLLFRLYYGTEYLWHIVVSHVRSGGAELWWRKGRGSISGLGLGLGWLGWGGGVGGFTGWAGVLRVRSAGLREGVWVGGQGWGGERGWWLGWLLGLGWLKTAADACVLYDINSKQKQ